jgi:hypothetical protein
VNLRALVGKVLYTGTSPSDDFARVNNKGIVKGLFADLEPAANPSGDILQFYAGKHHRYKLFNPIISSVYLAWLARCILVAVGAGATWW